MEKAVLPTGSLSLFFTGVGYPLAGVRFLSRHRLWHLAVVPVAVNVVLLALLIGATLWWAVPQLEALDAWLAPTPDSWALVQGFFVVLRWVAWVAAIVVLLAVSGIFIVMVGQAIASPFLDLLSEHVETIVLGEPAPAFSMMRAVRSVLVGLADLVWALVLWLVVNALLLLLHVVPAVGTAVSGALSFAFTALLLAQEFVGLPLVRQFVSYNGRLGVVWRNRAVSLGFGTTTMVMLIVPGLNLVLLPLAAVGGTLLYCDLKSDRLLTPARRA